MDSSGLTAPTGAAMLSPVATLLRGIGVPDSEACKYAATMRFFYAQKLPSYYDRVSKAVERLAGPSTSTPTLFILSPMIGVFGDRFKTYIEGNQP